MSPRQFYHLARRAGVRAHRVTAISWTYDKPISREAIESGARAALGTRGLLRSERGMMLRAVAAVSAIRTSESRAAYLSKPTLAERERGLNQEDSHRIAAEMLASKLGWLHDGQCRAVLVQSSATYDGCNYQFSLLHQLDLQDAVATLLSRTA